MAGRRILPGDPDPFGKGRERMERHLSAVTGHDSRVVVGAALVLVGAIKQRLKVPPARSGREYPRGKKTHVASAPGESPAPDKGELLGSISYETVGGVMRVGSGLEKAPALEFGTETIEPRPFMRPAYEDAKADMTDVVVARLRQTPP